jgi:hypothetical protein
MTQPVSQIAPALARANPAVTASRLAKAAEDFTAVAIGEMLKPMFNTADTSNRRGAR